MSKAKPTPAPWELRGWSIKHPGNGFRICVVEQPDKGLRQFGGGDYEEMLDECRANAELIVMAPALAAENVALHERCAAANHGHELCYEKLLSAEAALVEAMESHGKACRRMMDAEAALAYAVSTGDECAIEVEALRSRLAEADEQIAALQAKVHLCAAYDRIEARLAEAEALLREAWLQRIARHPT